MLSRKSSLTRFYSHTLLLVLLLLAAATAGAQTQTGSGEQSAAGARLSGASTVAKDAATVAPSPADKPVADSARPEVGPSKAEDAPPGVKSETPAATPARPSLQVQAPCQRMVNASVVAMAQPIMLNRLGATLPGGMIFALEGDTTGTGPQVQLARGKRPLPIALRANVGDCLRITLTNDIPLDNFKITPTPTPPATPFNTSEVSIHVEGMEWVTGSGDDGSFVGRNNSSLVT